MTKDDRYGVTDDDYGDDLSDLTDSTGASTTEAAEETGDEESSDDETDALPFIFARRTVKADREAVPVYVQDETASEIEEVERKLDQQFDSDKVMALDVREALVRAGLDNFDDVERVMEEWGYGRR
ncbi:hypothetical protein [Halomicrococcus gelatinilyticus]|uniref:hypothetical protein n=1 Tax=Halomicrococcus gelatinilyticus TaxID=1702103 RepID=UPI002E1276A8